MTYLSIIEKLKILFNMMLDNKIVLIFLIAVIAISLLYFIKVISYKKSISLILIALIITLITSISTNYKVLSKTFDNFMTILFSNIYFPSIYVYLVILLISMIVFIVSLFNTILKKSYKIVNNIFFFIIYLFGFKNSFAYGTKYIVAINLATLVTDLQWDIETSVSTVAKIDISKNKFVYKEHLKNALKLNIILISSVIVMSLIGVFIYKPNMFIFLIFMTWHIIDFMLTPFTNIKISYLQLEYSSFKTTFNEMIAFAIRTFMSFIPTPFCTIIGQMCSSIYEFTYSTIKFGKIRIGINKEN